MPYIKEADRSKFDMTLDEFYRVASPRYGKSVTVGDLNYLITKMLLGTDPITYTQFNNLIGMLECCKLELYRRAVAVYEDKKIKENGDVY